MGTAGRNRRVRASPKVKAKGQSNFQIVTARNGLELEMNLSASEADASTPQPSKMEVHFCQKIEREKQKNAEENGEAVRAAGNEQGQADVHRSAC